MTRKYARTMDEAFPGHGTYSCAVHRPNPVKRMLRLAQAASFAVMFAGLLALMLAYFDVLV